MSKPLRAIIFFITIFSGVYFFTACEDTGSNDALNIEYSIEAVNKAISDATKNQDPSHLNVGQFVKYEDNYQIELTDPKISATVETKILELVEDETNYTVTLQEDLINYDADGGSTQKVTEKKVQIGKEAILPSSISLFKSSSIGGIIKSNFSLQNDSELKIYNLSVEATSVPYPNKIQKRMGCDSNNPCLFNGTRIRFIAHEFVNKTDPIKFSVDRIYMDDGSFLNGTFSSCISRFFETPERDYYIKQCSVLRDYDVSESPEF